MTETSAAARTTWIVAAIIIAGGAVLRFWALENNPPGLWQDEASTGVDALLLWTTGRDRAGVSFPIIARSFGDYPLTLYRYLTAPIVGLLGLSIGHQRWVAAFGGTALLVATFAWARLALGRRVALLAALIGALTPTWVHFSRYGSEAILLPATLTAALALFEHARHRGTVLPLYLGAIALGLSTHTYHAVKLFLPLWLIPAAWFEWPFAVELWRHRRPHLIGAAALCAALILPAIVAALTPEGMARGHTVAAWTHFAGQELLRKMLSNYLGYLEPGMLFLHGGPAVAQSIPGLGIWNLIDLPLMIAGLVVMARRFREHRAYGLIAGWLLLGPIPGAITYETHNIGRVIGWLPAPQLTAAIGASAIIGWALDALRARPARRWARPVAMVALMALVAGWMTTAAAVARATLVRYPQIAERDWQFEISRALQCARKEAAGRHIVVSPDFQAADVFAQFHLAERGGDRPAWSIGPRNMVGPDEVFAFPAEVVPPDGAPLCEIRARTGGETRAWVYGPPARPQ